MRVPIPESLRHGKLTLFQSFLQHRQRYTKTSQPFRASISAEEDPSIDLGDGCLDVWAVAQLRVLPRCFNSRQRVLELMSVTMHLGGHSIRIREARIILQNFQEGYGFIRESSASDYCSAVSRTTPREMRLRACTRLSERVAHLASTSLAKETILLRRSYYKLSTSKIFDKDNLAYANYLQEAYQLFNALPPDNLTQRFGGQCGINFVNCSRYIDKQRHHSADAMYFFSPKALAASRVRLAISGFRSLSQ